MTTDRAETDWRHRAACAGHPPELFFPVGASGPALLQVQQAKAICATCPAMWDCRQWAIENHMDDGVWGGLAEDERPGSKRRNQERAKRARHREQQQAVAA